MYITELHGHKCQYNLWQRCTTTIIPACHDGMPLSACDINFGAKNEQVVLILLAEIVTELHATSHNSQGKVVGLDGRSLVLEEDHPIVLCRLEADLNLVGALCWLSATKPRTFCQQKC